MRRKATVLLSVFLGIVVVGTGSATSVLPVPDGELADQAAVIAEGTIIRSGPSSVPGRPAMEYRLRVERLVKGEAPGGTLVVRVPGGAAANGLTLKIFGAPEFRIGERALLFLVPNKDGTHGPLHLALGAFHELYSGDRRLIVRDLSEVYQVGAETAEDGVRDLGRFVRWLADRAKGVERGADYLVPGSPVRQALGEFNYLNDGRNVIKSRWLEFDRGQEVSWKAHVAGLAGFPGGGFAEVQVALEAWNADPGTNIRYRYNGFSASTRGFQGTSDGQNVVLFDDVNSEVPGEFKCSKPGSGTGVLAIGGPWIDFSTSPATIRNADIILNNGAGCWFTSSKRLEQVLGHELGHTLGLGHACGDTFTGSCNTGNKDEALMRAIAHADERGAVLQFDDKLGAYSLYPDPNGAPPTDGLAPPSGLTGTALSATAIRLTWTDNSGTETQFVVQMKKGAKYKTVKTVQANVTIVTISGLGRGKSYTFRVIAKTKKASSDASNEVTVQTLN